MNENYNGNECKNKNINQNQIQNQHQYKTGYENKNITPYQTHAHMNLCRATRTTSMHRK